MRRLLICIALLFTFAKPGAAQQLSLLPLTADQISRAGILFGSVEKSTGNGELRISGVVVYSINGVEIVSAPAAGMVQDVLVTPMQKVGPGAPLLRLYSAQFLEWQREYIQSATQETLVAQKLARDEALHKEGIIATGRLQETRNGYVQARVAAQERAQLLKLAGMSNASLRKLVSGQEMTPVLTLYSRTSGVAIEQMAMPGQRVEAGTPLVKIARSDALQLELNALQAQATLLAVGDAVEVAGCAKAGKVTAISPQVNPASQTVLVRADIPDAAACLRPNQALDATVRPRHAASDSFSVPTSALVRLDDRDHVFVRDAKGVRPVAVTVLARGVEVSNVRGNLNAATKIAVRGTVQLKGMWMGLGSGGEGK